MFNENLQREGEFKVEVNDEEWIIGYVRAEYSDKVILDYYQEDKDLNFLNYVCGVDMELAELKDFAIFQIGDRA